MIVRGRGSRMPCESCAVQFSVFKRKRACSECERYYCSGCLRRGGGAMCAPCRVLSTRPLSRQTVAHLKVRDLQCFLQRQNVSTRGCVEKEELVSLCITHVNSAAYRRRGPRAGAGAGTFTTLKGLTTNFNEFINSTFDLRNNSTPAPPPPRGSCFNAAHAHSPSSTSPTGNGPSHADRRFTTTPGGERDISVPVPEPEPALSPSGSAGGARVDTADCFEVEDLDDAGWEFVTRPADPLPNDSDVLLAAPGPRRAASELALPRSPSAADTSSLRDEPLPARQPTPPTPPTPPSPHPPAPATAPADPADEAAPVSLEQVSAAEQLERLSVKQLKALLARNRVEFRGCLERADLLERAQLLWRDHAKYKDEIDNLPIEECCKICMAAPLECVLLECGHIAACTACSKQLAECPICRQYVVRAVRFFRS